MSGREPEERPDFTAEDAAIVDRIWDRIGRGEKPTPVTPTLRRVADKLGLRLGPDGSKG